MLTWLDIFCRLSDAAGGAWGLSPEAERDLVRRVAKRPLPERSGK